MNSQLSTPQTNALNRICNEWYLSFGVMTLIVVLSLWASPLWMPLYELVFAVVLALFGPGRKTLTSLPCGRITVVTVYTLLASGLISFAITVAYKTEFVHLFFDISTLNHSIPYITSLIIFPMCTLFSLLMVAPWEVRRHARTCHLRNQYNPSNPLFGRMIHGAYSSLLKRLALMSGIISVIDWVYYFVGYRNVSINTPDSFFFFVVPAAIYAWSIINIRRDYSVLSLRTGQTFHVDSVQSGSAVTDSSIVRYLVVHRNHLLLDVSEQTVMCANVDTPLIEVRPHSFNGNAESVRNDFEHRTGLTAFSLKKLYETGNPISYNKIYHYLVSLDDDVDTSLLPGQWVDLNGIDNLLKMGVVSAVFADEIYRIHTITMAWKTYTERGERKYPIKNYVPTFRLSDLKNYEVDYDDLHWLNVSRNNQDKRMWCLRRYFLPKRKNVK